MATDTLVAYRTKRDFARTPEPRGKRGAARKALGFVVQKHAARRLHFDLRLEVDGVYKSWAVPKGPSLDPAEKRLAVQVEDHPLDYGSFEGTIPEGAYGAGTVQLWDRGRFKPEEQDPAAAIARGKLTFTLEGERLGGGWKLVRMGGRARDKGQNWLLMKIADEAARGGKDAEIATLDSSVASRRTMAEIAAGKEDQRRSKGRAPRNPAAQAAPAFVPPQLARTEQRPPQGDQWVHEIKFDGYRVQFRAAEGVATGWSRSGQDWTGRFAAIAAAVAKLPDCTLDGEVVALNREGQPDFAALQDALSRGDDGTLVYFVFDLLATGGKDLRSLSLLERKKRLGALLAREPDARLRYVEHFASPGDAVWKSACRMALEGIVSKRVDAPTAPAVARPGSRRSVAAATSS
jgi:bifunctional non-homologous end joining protein LigD